MNAVVSKGMTNEGRAGGKAKGEERKEKKEKKIEGKGYKLNCPSLVRRLSNATATMAMRDKEVSTIKRQKGKRKGGKTTRKRQGDLKRWSFGGAD
jgi:hypothetical protein